MRISVTILQYDHGIVRQVLDVVGEVIRTHRAAKHLPELKEAIMFMEQFLDRFHHAKEERFLFPAAAEECPKVIATLERLMKEHAKARKMIHEALKALDEGDVSTFERQARDLVDHMTVHISEEENQVFPVIEDCLQLETDALVHAQYEKFMNKGFGKSYYLVSEEFANDIQERLVGPGFLKGIN
jgi:branched-chain amino acid transport system ATP-binding protein